MSFGLKMGHVGAKERYIAKRYIEDEYKEEENETSLWLEKTHNGNVRGIFFCDVEEILRREDKSISEYESFDDFIKADCGSQGQIDSLIADYVDESKDDRDYSFEELKEIVEEHYNSDIVEAFKNLKENEVLYILSDCNGEYTGTDKNNLILENLKDGQYIEIYSNVEEILESIESESELAAVFIYNYMSNYEKNKYSGEYEKYKLVC